MCQRVKIYIYETVSETDYLCKTVRSVNAQHEFVSCFWTNQTRFPKIDNTANVHLASLLN